MLYVFIVNPASGNNNGFKIGKEIDAYCKERGLDYTVIYTKNKGNATLIADLFKGDPNTIIYCVGGDGTLNEIINGMNNSMASLAVIPAGTGNDFYKTLKTFYDNKLDLCKVNDKYFINIASLGLDAEVADFANKYKNKKLPNKLAYILSLIKTICTFKSKKIIVNNESKDITIFTLCNGKYYGGGFKIDPKAEPNTGKLDLVEAKSMNKLKILKLLLKLSKGKHLESDLIDFSEISNVEVSSDEPLVCNVDGEIIKDTNFKFSIEKDAIRYVEDYIGITNHLVKKKLIDKR